MVQHPFFTSPRGTRGRNPLRGRSAFLAAGLVLAALVPARAADVVVQGSTTFNTRLIVPFQSRIEAAAGHSLKVQANKSSAGLLALIERRADLAMISAPLESELQEALKLKPELDAKDLVSHEVSRTRVAFVTHPGNPVASATLDVIRRVLVGEIVSWKELGGPDLPIRVVAIRDGGGVQTTVNMRLLGGGKVTAPNTIWVQHGSQVIKVVEQEPAALGIAQLGLARSRNLPEIATDKSIEQILSLVTVGEPSPDLVKVIEATREVAGSHLD